MLEMTRIRTERDELIQALKKRNIDVTETIDALIEKDQQWRNAKTQMESITADLNKIAKEIGAFFKLVKPKKRQLRKQKRQLLKQMKRL